jgi:hypothetical protein
MTTVELNAQLLQQLGYIVNNESYLQKTLDFINKLIMSSDVVTPRGQVYTELLERLSDFQEYERGWDGEDALPLDRRVIKNFKSVLQKSHDSDLQDWTIFPAANGTLLLQNKKRKSGINIGANGFSYYAICDGEAKGENNLKLSAKAILDIMKRI